MKKDQTFVCIRTSGNLWTASAVAINHYCRIAEKAHRSHACDVTSSKSRYSVVYYFFSYFFPSNCWTSSDQTGLLRRLFTSANVAYLAKPVRSGCLAFTTITESSAGAKCWIQWEGIKLSCCSVRVKSVFFITNLSSFFSVSAFGCSTAYTWRTRFSFQQNQQLR